MSKPTKLLPTEVATIVHHVELNRAGWWDRALQRLILATVWLSETSPNIAEIQTILRSEFRLNQNDSKVRTAIELLESQSALLRLDDDRFRIPDERRVEFEREIAQAEQSAVNARNYFTSLTRQLCPDLDPVEIWTVFESDFLAPLIKEVGANAYHLIAGKSMVGDKRIAERFLERFDPKLHQSLNELLSQFLDPKKDEVRTYVSRLLHATFCVEASGLPEAVVRKLTSSSGKQITFRVFVDTNFLFSMLALHENPSNEAAADLQELLGRLAGNPKVDLYVTSRTIDEIKHSISLAKEQLGGVPSGNNFTRVALRAGLSGMAQRFLAERLRREGKLSPADWFDPYLKNFVPIARGKGVELFNKKLDAYATRQDVVDDILLVERAEARRRRRPKTYEMIEHDMILWHLVNDQRPAYIESPVDAQDWILTVDFRLIGFDEHKQRDSNSGVPICLHPTALIQLLQFWVPRTTAFEEAILGSLRLPFLFQGFDAEAERTSLRILKGVGRFEGSQDLPEEAIADVLLNEGLRARIRTAPNQEVEAALVRDALLEELKVRADAEANRAQQLDAALKTKDENLSALDAKVKERDQSIGLLEAQLASEAEKARTADRRLQLHEREIEELKRKSLQQENDRRRNRAVTGYLLLLFLAIAVAVGSAAWIGGQVRALSSLIGLAATRVFFGVFAFTFSHLLIEWWARRREPMKDLWPFRQISRFRAWLWTLVILGFVGGVVGNLVANRIQQEIDRGNSSPAETQER